MTSYPSPAKEWQNQYLLSSCQWQARFTTILISRFIEVSNSASPLLGARWHSSLLNLTYINSLLYIGFRYTGAVSMSPTVILTYSAYLGI
jgi:hypothetical protein